MFVKAITAAAVAIGLHQQDFNKLKLNNKYPDFVKAQGYTEAQLFE